jgi:lipopolysaccharide export system protein LptA
MVKSVLLLCIVWFSLIVYAQDDDVIIIRGADSLIGRTVDGENIRELVGNVIFEQNNVIVYCDRAIHYPRRNSARLEGNVRVEDDTVTLKTERGFYNGRDKIMEGEGYIILEDGTSVLTARSGKYNIETREAEFWENVVVNDPSGIVYADHLVYRRDDKYSTARGNVRVIDPDEGSTVYGGYLVYDNISGYSSMEESPVLVQIDTTETGILDTLILVGTRMESFRDTIRTFVASEAVEMLRSDLAAKGQKAVYILDADELSLTGTPILWYQNNQVIGDSIHVTLEERVLRKLEVFRQTFTVSLSDERFPERFNQLTGTNLTMLFSNDQLEQVDVAGQATSVYYVYEESEPNGVNHVSGDHIRVSFVDGEIHELKITGGIEGKYYPENLVRGNEAAYNLPGFIWRTDRPALSLPLITVFNSTGEFESYE